MRQSLPTYNWQYRGSLDLLEGKLNRPEFLHLLFDFIPKHLVDEDVCEENLPPLLFILILVLDRPFSNFDQLCFSLRVDVLKLYFFLDHDLEVADVFFPF